MEREEPVNGRTVPDVVQSLDRNLRQVVSETIVEIDKFLAAVRSQNPIRTGAMTGGGRPRP